MWNRKLAEKMTQPESCMFHPFAGITLFRFNGFYLSLLLKAPRGRCCKYIRVRSKIMQLLKNKYIFHYFKNQIEEECYSINKIRRLIEIAGGCLQESQPITE